jgi:hypothetical protein
MDGHGPLLGREPERQKQQLQRRFFVGESTARLDDLAQRPVQRFDAVGRVDCLANVRRVVERNNVLPELLEDSICRKAQRERHTSDYGQTSAKGR